MSNDNWKGCKVLGWQKLSRACHACNKPNAEIEFRFSCKGLPSNYFQHGEFVNAWHWLCLPYELKDHQRHDEASMIAELQKPFGTSHD